MIELDRTLVLTLLIALFGGIVAATAGFGFSLVAAPPLLLLYEPVQVTAMLLILALATRWMLLTDTWHTTHVRTIGAMLPSAWLGIGIGILIVRAVDPDYIKLLASLVVIVAALLLMRGWRPERAHDPAAGPVAGLLSGILSPTTGMDGTPVVFLLSSRDYSIAAFRSTITVYYYLIIPVTILALVQQGLLGRDDFVRSFVVVPPVVIGTMIGQRLVRRMSVERFRSIVFGLLLVSGLVGAVAALMSLR
ncbi:MAG: sulfite exporter TauE/SafE family protein [Thermomicrobiales bacterium]|nr:MAG: sulfite exporter TauE/SafE family protein [Thermomicrobiales bacterium]